MKHYKPNPLDTGDIHLDSSLTHLKERLAENIHDVWAKTRVDDGWT